MWKTEWSDFGPRLGAAYRITDSLVMRGGYGITFVPSNTGFNDGPGFYGAASFTKSVNNAPYGSSPAGVVVGAFNSMAVNQIVPEVGANPEDPRIYGGARRFPIDYQNGYIQQWNFFLEQKLAADWVVSAGYVGSGGRRLQVAYVPINSPQLVDPALLATWRDTYIASDGKTNLSTQMVQNPWQPATGPLTPYGNGNIRNRTISRIETYYGYPLEGDNVTLTMGSSDYHALQLAATHQFADGLQLNVHYTWSKQIGIARYNAQTNQGYADGGETAYLSNRRPDMWHLNRKITTNDIPHRIVINWVYDLPVGKGKQFNIQRSILDAVIGGWRLAGSITGQSGFVRPLTHGGTNSFNGLPDRVPGVPLEVPKELQRWYDGNTDVTLPSGRIIRPCNGCFLKYNIDAFAGRTVAGPSGTPIADLFWYGNSAATFDDMRSNPTWNTNLSLEKSFTVNEKYSFSLSAQATNLVNNAQLKPGINTAFGATVLPATVTANPKQNLKVGQLMDTTSTFGAFTQSTYDPRQIEVVLRLRF